LWINGSNGEQYLKTVLGKAIKANSRESWRSVPEVESARPSSPKSNLTLSHQQPSSGNLRLYPSW